VQPLQTLTCEEGAENNRGKGPPGAAKKKITIGLHLIFSVWESPQHGAPSMETAPCADPTPGAELWFK